MKRKISSIIISLICIFAIVFTFSACGNEKTPPEPEKVAVTSVTLSPTTLSLVEGEKSTLTATVAPEDATDKSVSWSSSAPAVATVSKGVVTAVAAGNATITVTSNDGNKTATCSVTVSPAHVSVSGVTLNKTEVSLVVGGSETLTATVAPTNASDKAVSWSSSATEIATVENGVITALAVGTAKITVTTNDGNKTASCDVKVTAAPIAVTGVSLDKKEATLTVGGTETLTVSVVPSDATNKTVSWSTSDEKVATVSDGVVTAKGVGTATITVTTADGNYTANCAITVSIPVTGVSLDSSVGYLLVGETVTLNAKVSPNNATNKTLRWSTSAAKVATVANGVVKAEGVGTATITVTTVDGNKSAEYIVNVYSADTNGKLNKFAQAELTSLVVSVNTITSEGFSLTDEYDLKKTEEGYEVNYTVERMSQFSVDEEGNFVVPDDITTVFEGSKKFDKEGNVVSGTGYSVDMTVKSLSLNSFDFSGGNFGSVTDEAGVYTAKVNSPSLFFGKQVSYTDIAIKVSYTETGISELEISYNSGSNAVKIVYKLA